MNRSQSLVSERVSPGLVVGVCILREEVFLVGDDGSFGSMGVSRILPSPHCSHRCGRCGRILGI